MTFYPNCVPAGEAEIRTIEINREMDQFVILASDGLWDVMSSEEAVQYVHSVMEGALGAGREGEEKEHASKEAGSGDGSGESAVNCRRSGSVLHRIVTVRCTLGYLQLRSIQLGMR